MIPRKHIQRVVFPLDEQYKEERFTLSEKSPWYENTKYDSTFSEFSNKNTSLTMSAVKVVAEEIANQEVEVKLV